MKWLDRHISTIRNRRKARLALLAHLELWDYWEQGARTDSSERKRTRIQAALRTLTR